MSQPNKLTYPLDLADWQKLYPAPTPAKKHTTAQLVGQVIAEFDQFATGYRNYFEGSEGIITKGHFKTDRTTASHLQAQVLQALNDYWAPISQVAVQRQVKHYRVLLDQGTTIAEQYLKRLKLPGVLIYFDKVTSIRYTPYTQIAFIGIPYELVVNGDWMGIPHELGHYIYWNLAATVSESLEKQKQLTTGTIGVIKEVLLSPPSVQPDPTTLSVRSYNSDTLMLPPEKIDRLVAMVMAWFEETFADVVGTWLGDDAFVSSLKALMERSAATQNNLFDNDGHHPPLYIRSFIRRTTQEWLKNEQDISCNEFYAQLPKQSSMPLLEQFNTLIQHIFQNVQIDQLAHTTIRSTLLGINPEAPFKDIQKLIAADEFTVEQIKMAMTPLIAYLVKYLHCELLPELSNPQNNASNPLPTFQQWIDSLMVIHGNSQKANQTDFYEVLLRPRVLEGGNDHTHEMWGWHGGLAPEYHGSITHTAW